MTVILEALNIEIENYWLLFSLIVIMGMVFSYIYYQYIHKIYLFLTQKISSQINSRIANSIRKPMTLLIISGFTRYAFSLGEFSEKAYENIDSAFGTVIVIFVSWSINTFLTILKEEAILSVREERYYLPFFVRVVKVLIVMIAIYLILIEWGYDLGNLLTVFSIVSAALAFAMRETFGSIFSGIVIVFERPFKIGDFISTDDTEGTIVDISFRSTKILTNDKQEITVPNNLLVNTPLNNKSKAEQRKVEIFLGVTRPLGPVNEFKQYLLSFNENGRNLGLEMKVDVLSIYPEVVFFKIIEFTDKEGSELIDYKQEFLHSLAEYVEAKEKEIYFIGFEKMDMHK